MVTPNKNLLRLAEQKLQWLTTRQNLLAQNVANASTPNYVPSDLRDFASVVGAKDGPHPTRSIILKTTNPAHQTPTVSTADASEILSTADPSNIAPNGNGVFVEMELMKASETGMKMKETVALVEKYSKLRRMSVLKR